MKVQFDDDILVRQRRGGISTYFAHLAKHLGAIPGVDEVLFPKWVRSLAAVELGLASRAADHPLIKRPFLHAANVLAQLPRRRIPDVIHFTFYSKRTLKAPRRTLKVITVHDMAPEVIPEAFPLPGSHGYKMRQVDQADLIICVSKATRADLIEIAPAVAKKSVVVPLATSDLFLKRFDSRKAGGPSSVNLVFVGARFEYKAFPVFARAVGRLQRAGVSAVVTLVGGGPLTEKEVDLLVSSGVSLASIRQLSPTDAQLAELYSSATLLSYPSNFEGFGLPVLDAMAAGCPVITSNHPALVEVGGGFTLIHAQDDDEELSILMHDVVAMRPDERETFVSAAHVYASKFTWQSTAEQTLQAYTDARSAMGS